MTHNELLEEIDDRFSDTCDAHCESCSTKNFPIKALRAVVELHSPFDGYCQRCTVNNWGELRQEYPCDEIQAIEKELSNV
jgi:hypothetical protein